MKRGVDLAKLSKIAQEIFASSEYVLSGTLKLLSNALSFTTGLFRNPSFRWLSLRQPIGLGRRLAMTGKTRFTPRIAAIADQG
jgi:hypothetical protein